jgi:hypothetical protein
MNPIKKMLVTGILSLTLIMGCASTPSSPTNVPSTPSIAVLSTTTIAGQILASIVPLIPSVGPQIDSVTKDICAVTGPATPAALAKIKTDLKNNFAKLWSTVHAKITNLDTVDSILATTAVTMLNTVWNNIQTGLANAGTDISKANAYIGPILSAFCVGFNDTPTEIAQAKEKALKAYKK